MQSWLRRVHSACIVTTCYRCCHRLTCFGQIGLLDNCQTLLPLVTCASAALAVSSQEKEHMNPVGVRNPPCKRRSDGWSCQCRPLPTLLQFPYPPACPRDTGAGDRLQTIERVGLKCSLSAHQYPVLRLYPHPTAPLAAPARCTPPTLHRPTTPCSVLSQTGYSNGKPR